MDDAAYRHAEDDGNEGQQHLRPVGRYYRQEQGEDADGRNRHDHGDDLVADFGGGVKEANEHLGFFAPHLQDANADEEGEDDDREDLSLCHGIHRVRGDHADKDLHDGRGFFDRHGGVAGYDHTCAGVADKGHGEADDDGDGCRNEVDDYRLHADAP